MAHAQDTILIVEDDQAIARLLDVYLTEQGYRVLLAVRGQDALELCRSTPPDLVVLDVRLPDISGYDVGIALRASPETQHIPIIVLTAFGERADRLTAHNLVRADYFLGKPFDIEEVASVIRNQLSEGRRRGQYHPVTNLPTGELVSAQLRELLVTAGWTLALVRVRDFDRFTQRYGVLVGEDVLKLTALLLSEAVRQQGDPSDFVGQLLIGPSFVIISQPRRIAAITAELRARFDIGVGLHYDYRDLQQGHTPRMALAIGLLGDADGPFSDIRELTEAAEARL